MHRALQQADALQPDLSLPASTDWDKIDSGMLQRFNPCVVCELNAIPLAPTHPAAQRLPLSPFSQVLLCEPHNSRRQGALDTNGTQLCRQSKALAPLTATHAPPL